jgi:hypothetical protein
MKKGDKVKVVQKATGQVVVEGTYIGKEEYGEFVKDEYGSDWQVNEAHEEIQKV